MTLVLILFAVFNAGFLIGTWWGSGWRRRELSSLRRELGRLQGELQGTGTDPDSSVVYLDPPSTKQTG